MDVNDVERKVIEIVADALDRDPALVTPNASLVDDLGAESIDFLDIVFRLEAAFDISIEGDAIWEGSVGLKGESDPAAIAKRISELKTKMPGYRWDRLPANPGPRDLPRLITVQTILDYLARVLPASPA
jgi:acyl carrier protein